MSQTQTIRTREGNEREEKAPVELFRELTELAKQFMYSKWMWNAINLRENLKSIDIFLNLAYNIQSKEEL